MASDDDDTRACFRFLQLPNELRLKLYRYILPYNERIHLDPDNVLFPIPYIVPDNYGMSLDLLLTCKKIHHEATEFIYANNTVNTIETRDMGDFLVELGLTACRYLSKLECHVQEGFVDLGDIWDTLRQCPRITSLRLVFYHERETWSKTLAQIANYVQANRESGAAVGPSLYLEMHASIWAYRYVHFNYQNQFNLDLNRAKRSAKVYQFELPQQLRSIVVTASVSQTALQNNEFASWGAAGNRWAFRVTGSRNTQAMKTMRMEEIDNGNLGT